MDDSLHINLRRDTHEFATVINNTFYKDNRPLLDELFDKSLKAKHSSYSMFDIQSELLGFIIAAASAYKKYLRWKDRYAKVLSSMLKNSVPPERIKKAQERITAMDNSATAAKWFVGHLRSIGDGIAWWFFNYDRASLRILAEHDYISVPEIGAGLLSEIKMFSYIAAKGQPVLLNSVTNFLRAGDITIYDKAADKYRLVEVKSGQIRDARTLRQDAHRVAVQEALATGSHSLTGRTIKKIVTNRPLLTFVRSLERAMREAQSDFYSTRIFGDYLSFAVFNLRMLSNLQEHDAKQKMEAAIGRMMSVMTRKTDVPLPTMHSMLPTIHFSRMLVPYVIYPIAQELRLDLLTGDFNVLSQLNISGLARWLEKRGWRTKVVVSTNNVEEIGQFVHVPVLRVWKNDSPKAIEITLDIMCTAAMEFWMPESIERFVNAGITQGIPGKDYTVYFANTGKYAWD